MKKYLNIMGWVDVHGKVDWSEIRVDAAIALIFVVGVSVAMFKLT